MAKACATQSITKLVFLTLKVVRKQWQLTNELILIKTPATTLCKTCVAFKRFTNAYVFVIYDFKKYLFPVNRTLFIQTDEKRQTETKDTKNYPLPSLGPVENSVAERVEKFRESSKKGIDVLLTA